MSSLLSAVLDTLVNKLAGEGVADFFHSSGSKREISFKLRLQSLLTRIRAVADDAEAKATTSRAIGLWLKEVTDALYDTEDLVDEIAATALRRKLEAESHGTTGRLRKLVPGLKSRVKGKVGRFDPIVESIELLERIELLAQEADTLDLVEGNRWSAVTKTWERPATTSLVNEVAVYGRYEDKEAIVRLLLSDDSSSDRDGISVISIVGMGGSGKTTLAQLVFNDHGIKSHFELQAWVSVGDEFDMHKVIKSVLESVTYLPSQLSSLDLLQSGLKKAVEGKRFFVVLDDIWSTNYEDMLQLRAPLSACAKGSRILITTRSTTVAKVFSTLPPYHLQLLSDECCWSLFARHAFPYKNPHPGLKEIGKQIVRKCGGLPVAAILLGSLLRNKTSVEEWTAILNNELRDISDDSFGFLATLRLSYNHLPGHLKRCFAYCSMFPSDYEFEEQKLALLWMAEGFLQQPVDSNRRKEDVGGEYFKDLASRSIFYRSIGNESHYVMHDLLRDLGRSVSGDFCLTLEDDIQHKMPEQVRHLSYRRHKHDSSEKFNFILKARYLRTFVPGNSPSEQESCHLSDEVLQELLVKLPRLRVLSLPFYSITTLSDAISNLKHLRFLDLSHTALKTLPESICSVYFLETLILSNCRSFTRLPKDTCKLINLYHLDIRGTDMQEMPLHMSRLKNLQTLTNFIVGIRGSSITELSGLSNLCGALSISKLQNFVSENALHFKLEDMRHLNELELEWSSRSDDDPINDREVLENIQPPRELKKLTIVSYRGQTFPDWFGDPSFVHLVSVYLFNCTNCLCLPTLGLLPSLEDLWIDRLYGITSIGEEFYGKHVSSYKQVPFSVKSFPSLKTLRFRWMLEWKEWRTLEAEGEEFQCLEELHIEGCPQLMGIPKRFPSLTKLVVSECASLLDSLHLLEAPDRCVVFIDNMKVQLRSGHEDGSLSSSDLSVISQHSYGGSSTSTWDSATYNVPLKPVHTSPSRELPQHAEDRVNAFLSHEGVLHHQYTSPGCLKVSDASRLQGLGADLQSLRIEGCSSLKSLPIEVLNNCPFLESLYINDCHSLQSIPEDGEPTTLKRLHIRNCKELKLSLIPEMGHRYPSLENLCIWSSCDPLSSFPLNLFPQMKILCICDCANLESLSVFEGIRDKNLKSLEALEIRDCPNFISFPKAGLPTPNLTSFIISNCINLPSLPKHINSLKNLQSLFIERCPNLESLPSDGFPTSLSSLSIAFCDKLTLHDKWKLNNLDSLSHFEIEGKCEDLEIFPEEGLLPTNLVSLRISGLKNINELNQNGSQQLEFLDTLEISSCEKLSSLPEELPSALSFLSIKDCPLLKAKLQNGKGKSWSKFSHIPSIYIDEVEFK